MSFTVVPRAERPDRREAMNELPTSWPRFMMEDPAAWMMGLLNDHPAFQLALLDGDRVVARRTACRSRGTATRPRCLTPAGTPSPPGA